MSTPTRRAARRCTSGAEARTQPIRRPPQYALLMPPMDTTRECRSKRATGGGIAVPSSGRSTKDSSTISSVPAACAVAASRSRSSVGIRWPVGFWNSGIT